MIDTAISLLREQQSKAEKWSTVWTVAEQLMDICREDSRCAALIAKDLENKDMSIVEAEKQIKALADAKHGKGADCVAVSPREAENALRKFYGLPTRDELPAEPAPAEGVTFRLSDFLGGDA